MSIASQLQAYENGLTDAYNMVSQRGGTMPVHKNMSSLASSIATIPSGGLNYGIPRVQSTDGTTLSIADAGYTYTPPSGITAIGAYALQYAFYGDNKISSADLSAITSVGNYGLSHAFDSSTISSADLSAVTAIGSGRAFQYAFNNCPNLTTITVGAISGYSAGGNGPFYYAFSGCTSLTTATIRIKGMFQNCCYHAFDGCTSLTSVSFPVLNSITSAHKNNVMKDMLAGCSGVTVHFPSTMQSTISAISDLTFGGTNTTISYDL